MRASRALSVLALALATAAAATSTAAAATVLKSNMTGAQIVNDDGGASRGVAHATLEVDATRGRVCFEIEYTGLGGKATAGYLRRGGEGEMSRPMATLFAGRAASPVADCVRGLSNRSLRRLVRNPQGHYVDLATRKLSKGAVRGQLRPASRSVGGPTSGGSTPSSGGSTPTRR